MLLDKKYSDAVVSIRINGKLHGSGVMVEDGRGKKCVVTCLHVINEAFMGKPYKSFMPSERPERSEIEVDTQGKRYKATLLRGNQHHDLCLLEIPDQVLPSPTLELAPADAVLAVGDEVYSVGVPKGEWLGSSGKVVYLNQGGKKEPSLIVHDAWSQPGCSGGALLDKERRLVGIQAFSDPSAIPVAWVKELLERKHRGIVSRNHAPKTEVDWRYDSIHQARHRNPRSFVKWVLARPQSRMASTSLPKFVRHTLAEDHVASPQDFKHVLEIVEGQTELSGRTPYKHLEAIAGCLSDQSLIYKDYLHRMLEVAQTPEQKISSAISLADHYLYRQKDMRTALHYFEVAEEHRGGEPTPDYTYTAMMICYRELGDMTKAQDMLLKLMENHYLIQRFRDTKSPRPLWERVRSDFDLELEKSRLTPGEHEKEVLWRKFERKMKMAYSEAERIA